MEGAQSALPGKLHRLSQTDLSDPDFVARTLERFEDTRRKIDAELDRRRG